MKRTALLLSGSLLLLPLLGCTGGGGSSPAPLPAPTAVLKASDTAPLFGATNVNITPTWTGGSAKLYRVVAGSPDQALAVSFESGKPLPVHDSDGFRSTETYKLVATNAAGATVAATVTITPRTVSLGALTLSADTLIAGTNLTFSVQVNNRVDSSNAPIRWVIDYGTNEKVTVLDTTGTPSLSWTPRGHYGMHTVTATSVENAGATAQAQFTVLEAPAAHLAASATTPPFGDKSVTLTPTWAGGSPVLYQVVTGSPDQPLPVSLENGKPLPVHDQDGFRSGETYKLVVTSPLGATAQETVTITPATVEVRDITVDGTKPDALPPPKLPINKEVQLGVTILGSASGGIQWSIMDADGMDVPVPTQTTPLAWTPSGSYGEHTITATSVDDPTKKAELTVIVTEPSAPVNIAGIPSGTVSHETGDDLELNVTADYARTYTWRFNGNAIISGPNPTGNLKLANLIPLQGGTYTCTVENLVGQVSQGFELQVAPGLQVVPKRPTITDGQRMTYQARAQGLADQLSYGWWDNGTLLSQKSNFFSRVLGAGDEGSTWRLGVGRDSTTLFDRIVGFSYVQDALGAPPFITASPLSRTLNPSSPDESLYQVAASGNGSLSYTWLLKRAGASAFTELGSSPDGNFSRAFPELDVSDSGSSLVARVSTPRGQVLSEAASLWVTGGIRIDEQPTSLFVSAGEDAIFYSGASIAATPIKPGYQWQRAAAGTDSYENISGETQYCYIIPYASPADSGSLYRCVLTNGTQTRTTRPAALFVGDLESVPSLGTPGWQVRGYHTSLQDGICTLVNDFNQTGALVWPKRIATDNLHVRFSATFSHYGSSRGTDQGFALVLADPGQAPTAPGEGGTGLGAKGIPGFVLGCDVPREGSVEGFASPALFAGRGEAGLWGRSMASVTASLPQLVSVAAFEDSRHDFEVILVKGHLTVLVDGRQWLDCAADVPPAAYLMFTGSTSARDIQVDISNVIVSVLKPVDE